LIFLSFTKLYKISKSGKIGSDLITRDVDTFGVARRIKARLLEALTAPTPEDVNVLCKVVFRDLVKCILLSGIIYIYILQIYKYNTRNDTH
jgi:hypothetical protein